MRYDILLSVAVLFLFSIHSMASQATDIELCVISKALGKEVNSTVGGLISECKKKVLSGYSTIDDRRSLERLAGKNRFAILPHKPNYILPVSFAKIDEGPYKDVLQGESFDSHEAKFQISIKYIMLSNLFTEHLDLAFAYTATSWWQVYNNDISAPFRETNYQPEFILSYSKPWSLLGLPVKHAFVSLNHQSNGQAGVLSRSWNRVIGGLTVGHGNFVWSIESWWRIPESKDDITGEKGGDNPNIERYLGYGTLGFLWKLPYRNNLEVGLRNNLRSDDNKGSVEVGWSFPLTEGLRGYVQYYSGYGEDLVGYTTTTDRIGLGLKLTDWL